MGLVWVFLVSGQMKLGHEKLYVNNGSPRSSTSQKEILDSRVPKLSQTCQVYTPRLATLHAPL